MNEFDQIWESSRHNDWSFAFPLVMVCGFAVLAGTCFIKNTVNRRRLKIAVVFVCSLLAIFASDAQINEKWRIRYESLKDKQLTESQQRALIADGANRVFGPVAGGFLAMMYFSGGLIAVWSYRKVLSMQRAHFQHPKNQADDTKTL